MNVDKLPKIEFIEIAKLNFDPHNPRLPTTVLNTKDESEVIAWMLKDASILELMGAIGEKGFFPAEPLLVCAEKGKSDSYIVVEGNRRLAALKLLSRPDLAAQKKASIQSIISEANYTPQKVPAIIYDTRAEILDYLGFRHITGVKSWRPLAKAKYLKDLKKQYEKLSLDQQFIHLAKAIGSRADYARQLLVGLELFDRIYEKNYFGIAGLQEDTIDFGVFYNALRWNNIVKFLNVDLQSKKPTARIDMKNLEELVRWVAEKNSENFTRLGESRNLKHLNSIVGNKKALAEFRRGKSLEDAVIFTDEPDEVFRTSIQSSLKQLETANSYFPKIEIVDESDLEDLKSITKISAILQSSIRNKLN